MEKTDAKASGIEFRRDEDFTGLYANNVNLEATIWDLKMTFGQTDVAAGPNVVVQHTAITLPWSYVKLLSYLLQAQVAAREAEEGHIPVPVRILPAPPDKLPEEMASAMKHPKESLAVIQKLWKEFVAANPEMNP
jgi:hypothetical protein